MGPLKGRLNSLNVACHTLAIFQGASGNPGVGGRAGGAEAMRGTSVPTVEVQWGARIMLLPPYCGTVWKPNGGIVRLGIAFDAN